MEISFGKRTEAIPVMVKEQRQFALAYPGQTEVASLAPHPPVVLHGAEHDVIPAHAPIHFRQLRFQLNVSTNGEQWKLEVFIFQDMLLTYFIHCKEKKS